MTAKTRWIFYTLLAIFIGAGQASAADLVLGHPAYGGTGCRAGTADVSLSPDQKELSILFDDYVVEAGGDGRRIARKSCNIAIPVTVPQGFSIALFQVDYRGYVYVPSRGQARFSVEYVFAGRQGPRMSKTWRGEFDDEYLLSSDIISRNLVWSPCGAQTNLRVNSSMLVRTNRWSEEALATVDSADVKAGLLYHIAWRRCGGGNGGWD
jgi:hypothetical protein